MAMAMGRLPKVATSATRRLSAMAIQSSADRLMRQRFHATKAAPVPHKSPIERIGAWRPACVDDTRASLTAACRVREKRRA